MTEANNDNWSREGENADFSMEDFWLPLVADDGAGAVDEVLEIAPREVFLTFIFAACGLLWYVPHMICQPRRMEGDKICLQGILRHIFLRLRCDLSEGFDTTVCSWEILATAKKFEWIAAHERAAYPQTF
jgi:hypothetical protein